MMSAALRPIHVIWLSILLTTAQPAWANGLSCADLFLAHSTSQLQSSQPISQFLGKAGLIIESSVFQGQKRSVVLAPVDSWGRGENAKDLFVLALRVESNGQGFAFFSQLVDQMNSQYDHNWTATSRGGNVFEIPGVCTARVHPPYYARHTPMAQGHLEIEIEIQNSSSEVEVANQIGSVLQSAFKLRTSPTSLQHLMTYDLKTFAGRSAWGQEAFHEWLAGLSSTARKALDLISGADHREILPFLRGMGASSIPAVRPQDMIAELDAAIERVHIPVPVRLYRASSDPYSLEAWTRLSADENAVVGKLSDSAYTFTSLDQDFVLSWNQNQLRGQGIIIEIEAPAGLRAGYVDRGPQARDYAEIILARGQTLTPVRAYIDTSGQRRLVVTAP
jgi:hypothetical protein